MDRLPTVAQPATDCSEISMSGSAAAVMASEILEQVGELTRKHQAELGRLLEEGLQRLQGVDQSLQAPTAAAWCDTLDSLQGRRSDSSWRQGPSVALESGPRAGGSLAGSVELERRSLTSEVGPHSVVCMESMHAQGFRKPDELVNKVAHANKKKKKKKSSMHPSELLTVSISVTRGAQSPLQRFIMSRKYEVVSGTLILLNAVFIGWQTQFMASRSVADARRGTPVQMHSPGGFIALQVAFTVLFSIELGLRWFCEGLTDFFRGHDVWWNVLDIFVVTLGIADSLLHLIIEGGPQSDVLGNISVLRVARVVRVVRVARVIRVMRFFRELRMMIFSILGSMKSLAWVILILAMTFFMFGITFTSATTVFLDTLDKFQDAGNADLVEHFATLDRSILTLFMAMSGGNDWSLYYHALDPLPMHQGLFLLYITFAVFAVVNVVTGVFVETALGANHADKEVVVHEELEAKKAYLKSMREVFDEMDEDDTGCISISEFENKLNDERVIAYFNALKLDVSDARTLFRLLDYDQSNEVNIDEFLTGCYQLQGESRSLDMKIMQCEVRALHESFTRFWDIMAEVRGNLEAMVGPSSLDRTIA
mmetsp:Transcript_81507/g.253020  ORF Transcript_81507/g.253020 Transcript_81507/m.253020 type:complete len:595 (+) Transcript_81507:97-1881(+)